MAFDTNDASVVEYTLTKDDIIVGVGAGWNAAANEGGAPELAEAGVIGTSLWQWVVGEETQHLLSVILHKVRIRQASVILPYRCDTPVQRRYLDVEVHPESEGRLRLVHRVEHEEPRTPAQPFIQRRDPRRDDIVVMCSWCCGIKANDGNYMELEEAVSDLGLMLSDVPPKISHGICPSCERQVLSYISP